VDGQSGQIAQGLVRPLYALGLEAAGFAQRRVCQLSRADAPQERIRLQPRAVARHAGRVGAVTRKQHADVHLVCLRLEPREEALHAIPDALRPFSFAFDNPFTAFSAQLTPRGIQRNAPLLGELLQVLLTLGVRLRLPRLDRAAAQRFALVGNHQAVIDADGAAEAAAGLAGADRGVEGEQARIRRLIRAIALGAVQLA
jgi:hypothetical protein